tara:strand:- start:1266 stop:2279 length:1014 start_codon:yes stop_codon:yes gene_type:complete
MSKKNKKPYVVYHETDPSKQQFPNTPDKNDNIPSMKGRNKEKYMIFHVEGGLGKNIVATQLIDPLLFKHPKRKLIIVASHPQIFLNNRNVYRVYNLNKTQYFYQDYIKDKDSIIFKEDPYNTELHIKGETSLLDSWRKVLGLEDQENYNYILNVPINYSQAKYIEKWRRNKPILLLHTGGGPEDTLNHRYYDWCRDMPEELAQAFAMKFGQKYHVIQVTRPGGYKLPGVEVVDYPLSNYELFALVGASEQRVLIDSCLQHAAAAFNKRSLVLWIGTSPKQFGYLDYHKNVIARPPKMASQLIGSYLFDYGFHGQDHENPYYSPHEMFNFEDILNLIQ